MCASGLDFEKTRLALLYIALSDIRLVLLNYLSAKWPLFLDDLLDNIGDPHKTVT